MNAWAVAEGPPPPSFSLFLQKFGCGDVHLSDTEVLIEKEAEVP